MQIQENIITTTSVTLTKIIKEKEVELLVHFNACGEVVKIENDYLDLPQAAKLMIHGRLLQDEVRQLVVWIRVVKHILPMIASGIIEKNDLPDWLLPAHDALQNFSKENLDVENAIENKWTKQFHASEHQEKYRYFFRLFLLENDNMPPAEEVIEQLELLVDENIFLKQLEANDDFAKTYLLCLLLQTTKAYYIEPMIVYSDFSKLETLIDYTKVGLEMKDQKLAAWLMKNKDLPMMQDLNNFKVADKVLDGLLNTYVQKLICGTKIITMNDEL